MEIKTMGKNATVELIISRLPRKPILNAREIADALALGRTDPIVAAIESGKLNAAKVGKQYRISRTEAERWIRSLEASK